MFKRPTFLFLLALFVGVGAGLILGVVFPSRAQTQTESMDVQSWIVVGRNDLPFPVPKIVGLDGQEHELPQCGAFTMIGPVGSKVKGWTNKVHLYRGQDDNETINVHMVTVRTVGPFENEWDARAGLAEQGWYLIAPFLWGRNYGC